MLPKKNKVAILPTGDEIQSGIVADTNSPAIAELVTRIFPDLEPVILKAAADSEEDLESIFGRIIKEGYALCIPIGGSGGGRRFDPRLSKDCTHEVMESTLDRIAFREIYGSNGHLWSRLVVGQAGDTYFFNVPGPWAEAIPAAEAGLRWFAKEDSTDLDGWVETVAAAVRAQYPNQKE
ncbi:MAG: molybdopterin-binding protein [Candidatus Sumerlaeia bacterium]